MSQNQHDSDASYDPYIRPPATPSPQADEAFLRSFGRTPPPAPPRSPNAPYSPPRGYRGYDPGAQNLYEPPMAYPLVPRQGYLPARLPAQLEQNMLLNYWLSALFGIVPALIFFVVDKGKHPLQDEHVKEILNFAITRSLASLLAFIPVIGWFIAAGYFVLAILGALQGTAAYRQGRTYRYPATIRFLT
ncbi:DUF4870 domain-containing protein [Tessaracoccus sp. MC1756]|uniref:DUF4870 domain-containing protein n=1 Tax=Tessaracoccus sp. MC1756 TaxID=2760311 RepID=UPI0016018317|nr:DUF4870 domain-containing protein [Tessaracoccus sp. MC1756]